MTRFQLIGATWLTGLFALSAVADDKKQTSDQKMEPVKTELATLGGGCFWCVEAALEAIDGIQSVKSGYMGGTTKNPTYEQICDKNNPTGHIEVVQVAYDPAKISFDLLLEAFWLIHDPTSKDQQGYDKGIQYRSIIFYHDDAQKAAAEASIAKQNAAKKFSKDLVTELRKVDTFWDAEDYHQDFYNKNPNQGYCNALIPPKLFKLFSDARFKDKQKAK
jgi:peptide-methionine (S)-S-oxide reductase